MAGLISGYEYDVFISYRQNDNKYDGWVTSFVHNLTLELEATIKDRISVYFDINPHDGLLETHSVDKSLEEKLKCLIFIPIISKTYCDISAFAWQHEFCAFNRISREDRFGRDIRLNSGNFASRILPVKIHDLENVDKLLLENALGGSLRSIDFIYKSAGVNRPLRANEDHPHDNMNNTYYRDQINKVANSVDEIISALRCQSIMHAESLTTDTQISRDEEKFENKQKSKKGSLLSKNKLLLTAIVLVSLISILLKLFYSTAVNKPDAKETSKPEERISITVMPFENLTNDSTLNYLTVGVQEGVVTYLSFFPEEFKVRSFELIRSTLKIENLNDYSSITPITGSRISKRLDADFFLLGDIYKNERTIRLNTLLINANTEEIIRSFFAEGDAEKIMITIDSLSIRVRDYLLVSKIDKETFHSEPKESYKSSYLTSSPQAFRYHILGREALYNLDYSTALRMDSQAVALDSNFVAAIVTLCWEYYYSGNYKEAKKWLQKAYRKRDVMPLVQQIGLDYQYSGFFETPEEQIKHIRNLQQIEESNPNYYLLLGYLYIDLFKFNEAIPELEKAQELYKKMEVMPNDLFYYYFLLRAYNKTGQQRKEKVVLQRAEKYFIKNPWGTDSGDRFYKMALIYSEAGLFDKAEKCFNKGFSLNPGNQGIISTYAFSLIDNNLNVIRGLELVNSAIERDSSNGFLWDTKGWGLYRQHKYDESLKLLEKAYRLIPSYEIQAHIDSVKAAIATQN
jgi:tetratricopeptide (TPR) repeat protein/TolB-like protein